MRLLVRKPGNPATNPWPVLSSLPDFGIAIFYLLNLANPHLFGNGVVNYLILLVYVEFFVIFSAGFLAMLLDSGLGRIAKSLAFLLMSAGYITAITAFSLRFGQTWPIWAFCGLTVNRLAGIFINSGNDDRSVYARNGWLICTAIYLAAGYLAANSSLADFFDQALPDAGIADKSHWYLNPDKMALFGFLYFSSVAVFGVLRNYYQPRGSTAGGE